ncbi:hypothetical protein LTR85_004127 [Meristemomyces frigidus]|nr:hypothetical protein LTR85_004127 [Meristemomyces frigidus]
MAPKTKATDVQDVRTLAHKLYVQCRGTSSSYQLLTTSVRNLRNLLEDVDEVLIEERTFGPYETRVALRASGCRDVLAQLELALQQYRCSSQVSPSDSAVADFKIVVDVSAHELRVALEALKSTGEFELRRDMTVSLPTQAGRFHTASTSAASSNRGRKSSQSSSAWSVSNRDSPELSSATDFASSLAESDFDSRVSEEKEVYEQGSPLRSITADAGLGRSVTIPNWRLPFASRDPLSISIGEASAIIMDDEDNASPCSAARSKSSASSLFVDARTSQSTPDKADGVDAAGAGSPQRPATYGDCDSAQSTKLDCAFHHQTPWQDALPISVDEPQHEESTVFRSQVSSSVAFPGQMVPPDDRTSSLSPGPAARLRAVREVSVVADLSTPMQTQQTPNQPLRVPPLPSRAPPPPPVQQCTRSRTPSASRYIVANPSADCESHEDELYTTSRPASPVRGRESTVATVLEHSHVRKRSRSISDLCSDRDAYSDRTTASEERPSLSMSTRAPMTPSQGKANQPVRPLLSPWKCGEKFADLAGPGEPGLKAPPNKHSTVGASGVSLSDLNAESLDIRLEDILPPDIGSPELQSQQGTSKVTPTGQRVPPIVPPRPLRYRKKCYVPRITVTGEATSTAVDVSRDASLQLDTGATLSPEKPAVRPRRSVDDALNVGSTSGAVQQRPRSLSEGNPARAQRATGREQARSGIVEFYARTDPVSDAGGVDLDHECVRHCVNSFNRSCWDEAEAYLMGYLERLMERDDHQLARRVRHLIGVCASCKGETRRAINLFLTVLQTPVTDALALDAGECAAAYWLGDCYAMLNRRT